MEENKAKTEVIDLNVIIKKLWANRRLFYKVLPIVFVLSCIYALSLPRYYTSEVKLAPELDNGGTAGALSSIASSFGFDLGEMQTSDAITPLLYPDLMEDNGFVAGMFNIQVKSKDGEIDTNYHDYLKTKQKKPWWQYPTSWLTQMFKKKSTDGGQFDPYQLSKDDDGIAESIRNNVSIKIDKKTGVITINAKAQDPLVCKTLADSITEHLQVFITDYRTNKARTDYAYYKELTDNAKREYEKVRQMYGSMSDANTKIAMRSVELKLEDMENDMQLKFNAYTTLSTQLEAARAKVQERTPAFTVIKGAAVPVKHSGPKRMLFVLAMLFLATVATAFWLVREDLHLSF